MSSQLDLEQLRKQAKELVRARKAAGRPIKLTEAQLELARGQGFASWPKLKAHVERLGAEQPFHTDLEYYEGRADGIATVGGVTVAEARLDLARRHGFASWSGLRRHVEAIRTGAEPPTPFMLAYRAVEDDDLERLAALLDAHPGARRGCAGRTATTCSGWRAGFAIVRLLLERGADPNRGNDYGWTKLHQAGYANDRELAQVMLDAGGRLDVSARGDGGTPLIAALFWGHREVVDLLGLRARATCASRPGSALLDADPRARRHARRRGARRGFYRPHGGFPAWQPSDDPQEVLDEALVWAAKSGRVEALPLLVELGAHVDADPYRGTRARVGGGQRARRVGPEARRGSAPIRTGAGTFGGPDHGEGVTALHLAAQAGRREAVEALLELGADPTLRDGIYDGTASGWAEFGGHEGVAELLRDAEGRSG